MYRSVSGHVLLVAAVAGSLMPAPVADADPLGTAFTYQGELNFEGGPLNDTADFEFALFDTPVGGEAVGETIEFENFDVIDGIFAVQLDFGVEVFSGAAVWLEIAVRSPSGSGIFTTLSPRVPVSATPYALQTRGIFVDDEGNVVIGSTPEEPPGTRNTPLSKLKVTTPNNSEAAIVGECTATAGAGTGVYGGSTAPLGEGVRGEGETGVRGVSDMDEGKGIVGEASGAGASTGVHGTSTSPDGKGVHGEGATGVSGVSDVEGGAGLVGEATSSAGWACGVRGVTSAEDGAGVLGESSAAVGVMGNAGLTGGYPHPVEKTGVRGFFRDDFMVRGYGVHGLARTLDPTAAGVLAEGWGADDGYPHDIYAAALEVRNGAIRVSGEIRPAGTVEFMGTWTVTATCDDGPYGNPDHAHYAGYYASFWLEHALITDDSILILTPEYRDDDSVVTAHVRELDSGRAEIWIGAIPADWNGGYCHPPSGTTHIHYLIINPEGF